MLISMITINASYSPKPENLMILESYSCPIYLDVECHNYIEKLVTEINSSIVPSNVIGIEELIIDYPSNPHQNYGSLKVLFTMSTKISISSNPLPSGELPPLKEIIPSEWQLKMYTKEKVIVDLFIKLNESNYLKKKVHLKEIGLVAHKLYALVILEE